MSESRALRLGKRTRRKIFVPQRVLIETETRNGEPDHLLFWDVDVLNGRKDMTRLHYRSRLHKIPGGLIDGYFEIIFFCDWRSISEGKSENFMLV